MRWEWWHRSIIRALERENSGSLGIQRQFWIHSKSEVSLDYLGFWVEINPLLPVVV